MNRSAQAFDLHHIWHPYSSLSKPVPPLHVRSAKGVRLTLEDDTELIDGMASWWSAIHGYNHPVLNEAAKGQIDQMSHVMFGGLTHTPAIDLCRQLVALTPAPLTKVFLSDSGSVAVDVAMKMALQYWYSQGVKSKTQFVCLRGGYHGDTLGSMSVCDPDTGMHHLFNGMLASQHFVEKPACQFGEEASDDDMADLQRVLSINHNSIAALILEPIVQGAGGMYFYSADYLSRARKLCDEYNVLLIVDEIATGFARSGEFFACHHAAICPDIMCIGKAMTGGYLSLAATLTTDKVASGICEGEAGVFMHGPTFMANPLACSIANASISLLAQSDWRSNIERLSSRLQSNLLPANDHTKVANARVLGAIGVVETKNPVDMHKVQKLLPDLGVWLRPFGKLIYTMPPYIITDTDLDTVCDAIKTVAEECS
ncbi:adenosylmethionine--8-amino-7-oxononanoate transaminase [Pseudomonadales bacterium]|nr:adenosylmethionine--8-amino-7-oxononanoate transaminase [Pseudomonadales bacterium]